MIFFTSDLHLGHDRDFIYRPRGFNSVYEMNEAIVRKFQQDIKWTDELYILGDCMLGDNEVGLNLLKQIPGTKYVIVGNHDTATRVDLYKAVPSITVVGYSTMFKEGKFHALLSHYPTMTANFDDKGSRMLWNLSGHTHSKEKFQYWPQGIYNVAVDAHDCHPVSIEQIKEDIKRRQK